MTMIDNDGPGVDKDGRGIDMDGKEKPKMFWMDRTDSINKLEKKDWRDRKVGEARWSGKAG
jgi:hypothetical protein